MPMKGATTLDHSRKAETPSVGCLPSRTRRINSRFRARDRALERLRARKHTNVANELRRLGAALRSPPLVWRGGQEQVTEPALQCPADFQ